jgi:large subunit ribosomal protein L23
MEIIKAPIITEKSTKLAEAGTRYMFKVDKRANKIQIAKAIEELYGVTVQAVNTMNYAGKRKTRHSSGHAIEGRRPAYKKAYVKLKEGDTIDYFAGV